MFKPGPLGPVAGAFCLDNSEVAAIMGPVGSAKTTGSALRVARHAYEQHPGPDGIARFRCGIVRNTGPQLTQTTMKSWFELFPTDNKIRKWTSTTKTATWKFVHPVHKHLVIAEFIFCALDDDKDVAKLLGLEVTMFWFNELREIDPNIWAQAGARVGRYPSAAMGGCKYAGRIGDTNPWAATSDFHNMFVADRREGYKFFKQPGGMDPRAENLENLAQTPETLKLAYNDPVRRAQGRTYYEKLLLDYSKNDADMMVHCKYGASRAGKPVYEDYDDNVHCQDFELLPTRDRPKSKPYIPVLIGYDNTGRTPAAVIAQRTMNGQWRIWGECISEGQGMKAHAQKLHRFLAEKIPDYRILKITCDPAGRAKGADDMDMRMIVQAEFPGVSVVNARTNDIATRIEAFGGPLRRMVNGEPAVIIHSNCKVLRTACLTKYQYRRLRVAGEDRYTEEPDKSAKPYDDIANAGQYLMMGGGEGKVNSDGTAGAEAQWPKDGKAITPKPTQEAVKRQQQASNFDPRMGSFFNER